MKNKPKNEKQTLDTQESELIEDESQELEESKVMKKSTVIVFVFVALFGIITGFIISDKKSAKGGASVSSSGSANTVAVGISDEKTFKDSAEGVIEKGGFNGEGTHKLIRDGGPSQTVYLISSAVDLDEYEGKKVKVWGQTQAAQKVAWLMDVGKIEY